MMQHVHACSRTSVRSFVGRFACLNVLLLAMFQSGCSGGEPAAQMPDGAQATPVNQIATLAPVTGADWPQIRGSGGAGIALGETIQPWGKDGPAKVWSTKVGAGFSSPIVFGNHLFIMHRAAGGSEPMTADLVFADTGKIVWRQRLPCDYGNGEMDGDPGPKATPVYSDGKIFVYDPAGTMFCLDATNGETLWQNDLAEQYGTNKGYFGVGTSPIVCGPNVILNAGGRDASVVALDKQTGQEAWAVFDDRASYSSPVKLSIDNTQAVIVVTRLHVVGIDSESGKLAFKMRFGKTGPTAIGAMPVLAGNNVFINGAYNVGGKMLALSGGVESFGDDGFQPQTLWSDQDVFASQFSTPVLHKGMLYGTSGREDFGNGSFRCFDALTGELNWEQKNIAVGHTLLVGDSLLFMDHKANLRLIEASPDGYKLLSEFELYGSASKTIPAIAGGRLYTRSDGTNATLDCWKLK